jgi:hypothetical protein
MWGFIIVLGLGWGVAADEDKGEVDPYKEKKKKAQCLLYWITGVCDYLQRTFCRLLNLGGPILDKYETHIYLWEKPQLQVCENTKKLWVIKAVEVSQPCKYFWET